MNDFSLFDAYRRRHTRIAKSNAEYAPVEDILAPWREGKNAYLKPLFGDKLILEKKISYKLPREEILDKMSAMLQSQYYFVMSIKKTLYGMYKLDDDDWFRYNRTPIHIVVHNLIDQLLSASDMIDNDLFLGKAWDENEQEYKTIHTFTLEFENGKKVQLQEGMKITRAFTQICKQINMSDKWEEYRIAHSQVLNVKNITGTLCLSIHPLDYATASDNRNGWSSCMSWEDEGCYRMGTVEMMNSPMVICAYLKSDKQFMSIKEDDDWNSKKWRAWIIVNRDVIVCNRHYPYHHEDLAKTCIEWVRGLVKEAYGWKYGATHTDFYTYMRNVDHEIEFQTNYMYNDLGGSDVIGCMNEKSHTYRILFSGVAECMVCGKIIKPDTQDSSTLECTDCYAEHICSCCGCVIENENEIYYAPNNDIYCEGCYQECFMECSCCGTIVDRDSIYSVGLPIRPALIKEWQSKFHENDPVSRMSFFCDDLLTFHKYHIPSVDLCAECADLIGVTDEHICDWYCIPDPNKCTMEVALNKLRPPVWYTANLNINRTSRRTNEQAYYKLVLEFWKAVWNDFVAHYDDIVEDHALICED